MNNKDAKNHILNCMESGSKIANHMELEFDKVFDCIRTETKEKMWKNMKSVCWQYNNEMQMCLNGKNKTGKCTIENCIPANKEG